MQFGTSIINGFAFGIGIVLATAAMKLVFHMSICG